MSSYKKIQKSPYSQASFPLIKGDKGGFAFFKAFCKSITNFLHRFLCKGGKRALRVGGFLFFAILAFLWMNPKEIMAQGIDSTIVEIDSSLGPKVTPNGAIWRSLVLPGWGQLYVESYWKAPIFFGGAATLTYLIFYNHSNYADYADKLDNMELTDPNYTITKLWREYYRDNRDMSGFYLLAVYVLATVDAYVGAHLYGFEVSDDLSLNLNIRNGYFSPMIGITLNFK